VACRGNGFGEGGEGRGGWGREGREKEGRRRKKDGNGFLLIFFSSRVCFAPISRLIEAFLLLLSIARKKKRRARMEERKNKEKG
jgi:hypothetical protein